MNPVVRLALGLLLASAIFILWGFSVFVCYGGEEQQNDALVCRGLRMALPKDGGEVFALMVITSLLLSYLVLKPPA